MTDYKCAKNPRLRPTCSIFKYALTLQCLILSTIKDNKTKRIWLIYSMFDEIVVIIEISSFVNVWIIRCFFALFGGGGHTQ